MLILLIRAACLLSGQPWVANVFGRDYSSSDVYVIKRTSVEKCQPGKMVLSKSIQQL